MIETFTLRLTKSLKEKLKETAIEKGITINALILQILWDWSDNQKK